MMLMALDIRSIHTLPLELELELETEIELDFEIEIKTDIEIEIDRASSLEICLFAWYHALPWT